MAWRFSRTTRRKALSRRSDREDVLEVAAAAENGGVWHEST
jgi:hypothetical protein